MRRFRLVMPLDAPGPLLVPLTLPYLRPAPTAQTLSTEATSPPPTKFVPGSIGAQWWDKWFAPVIGERPHGGTQGDDDGGSNNSNGNSGDGRAGGTRHYPRNGGMGVADGDEHEKENEEEGDDDEAIGPPTPPRQPPPPPLPPRPRDVDFGSLYI
jgi:hypothetical protein